MSDKNQINKLNKKQILELLFSLQRFGIKPGLERTEKLLEFCGNPQNQFSSIHIAGTNGKGSVSSMIASVLQEAGCKVGLYTSPHILEFNERIRINGKQISDDELVRYSRELLPFSLENKCTFFEITTVLAFKYFADNKVDVAIVETGMGGRFDSTNILKPVLSVITSVAKDHEKYLGNSLEEIAFEKAGIIKQNTPVVLGSVSPELNNIFESKAKETKSKIIYSEENAKVSDIQFTPLLGMKLVLNTKNKSYGTLEIPLAGQHQIKNLITAITAIENMSEYFGVTDENIISGVKNVKLNTGISYRLELVRKSPPMIIDTAHNPDSVAMAVDTLIKCGYTDKLNILFAAMADKDINGMLEFLKPICKKLFITIPDIERAETPENIAKHATGLGFQDIEIFRSVETASRKINEFCEPALIIGSFYLVCDVLKG
ncbi:MAG: folylpolyglutamate synthase/dihydrofolate synthase family protein [Bacteroidota bacterium]